MHIFDMFSIGALQEMSKSFIILKLDYVKNTSEPLNFVLIQSLETKNIYSTLSLRRKNVCNLIG